MSRFSRSVVCAAALAAVSVVAGAPARAQNSATAAPAAAPAPTATPVARTDIPDTIMFTIDELNEIKDRISTGAAEDQGSGGGIFDQPTLYLQSILYYGPKDWTIWVNGIPVGPGDEFQTFQITEITPQYVQLLVPLSAQGMRPVRLEPNQTFITESGVTVEGRFP